MVHASLRRLRVAIVGGSMAGLFTGLALRKKLNCDVAIYERSAGKMESRGAGIVLQPELLRFLEQFAKPISVITVPSIERQYLGRGSTSRHRYAASQLFASWDGLYRLLRDLFPAECYHQGAKVKGVRQDGDGVEVRLETGETRQADLLVFADGLGSRGRRQFFPELLPVYAGYVAWRGTVPEALFDSDILELLTDRFSLCQIPQSHMLCYGIPGADGSTAPGTRRLNWVWYWNVEPGQPLCRLLTGSDGVERSYSVPPGLVPADTVAGQQAIGRDRLPPALAALVDATPTPSVQGIFDVAVPRMVFGRCCLVGDAAFTVRPHTASGTSKAAVDANTLALALFKAQGDVDAALQAWEPRQLALGRRIAAWGKDIGNRSQFPHDPASFAILSA